MTLPRLLALARPASVPDMDAYGLMSAVGTLAGGAGILTYGADRWRARRDRQLKELGKFRRDLQGVDVRGKDLTFVQPMTELTESLRELAREAHIAYVLLGTRDRKALQSLFDTVHGWDYFYIRGEAENHSDELADFMCDLSQYLSYSVDFGYRRAWRWFRRKRTTLPKRPSSWPWPFER